MAKWDVENVHYLETRNRRHPEDGFVETRKWVLYQKLLPKYRQGKQGIEVRIKSLSGDGSHSWVRISKGLNKFVRGLTEKARFPSNNAENEYDNLLCKKREASVLLESKHMKPAPKTTPKPTSASSSSHSLIHIPIHQRNWQDVEPKQHSQKNAHCFTFLKKMIALFRHGTLPREKIGAVEFWRLKAEFTFELLTVTTLVSSIMVTSLGNWRRTQEKIPALY